MLFIKNTLLAKLFLVGIFFFLLMMINCSSSHSKKEQAEVLASIKEMQVTKTQFENAFREYYYRTGQVLEADPATRKAILNKELNRYVLVVYARELGLDNSDRAFNHLELIKRRILNEEFLKQFLLSELVVTEDDLREYYIRSNTTLRASHLYAQKLNEILELQARLESGESFDSLSKEVFLNSYLAENGGDIGFFTTDEMDVSFEEVAFKLNVGEVSGPVKTAQGFSLIKLTARNIKPAMTEYDFASKKAQLEKYVFKKKKEHFIRDHLNKFERNIQFNETVYSDLWEIMRSVEHFKEPEVINSISNVSGEIARVEDFTFTVDEFLEEYRISSEDHLSLARNESDFRTLLTALFYRSKMYKDAIDKNLDKDFLIQRSIEETYYDYLINEVEDYIWNGITNSPAELYHIYSTSPEEFINPQMVNFSRIVVTEKVTAEEVLKEINKGASFENLVDKYTTNNQDRFVNGVQGLKPITDYGFLALRLRNLEINEVSDIIEYQQGEFHIYKCLDKKLPRQMSFDEARTKIDRSLSRDKFTDLKNQVIEDIKSRYEVVFDTTKLLQHTFNI